MTIENNINADDIHRAQQRLPAYICKTPVLESQDLTECAGTSVYLKLEQLQTTNSFKIRGASNAISQLTDEQKHAGVVCVSTGNHGRGIAFAAKHAGVNSTIYMSSLVPENKLQAIAELGATIKIVGISQDEAEEAALDFCHRRGAVYLPPFDHKDIISGQGTLGLEILAQCPDTLSILVPVSGGGLISGIAMAAKSIKPDCKIYGISMEKGAAMIESQKAGKPILVEELPTFADSLGGGIGLNNQYTFDMVKHHVDKTVQVSESEIAAALRHAYFKEKLIIEGGGAVGIAALLAGKLKPSGQVVVLLSGSNIDMNVHKAVLDGAENLNDISPADDR